MWIFMRMVNSNMSADNSYQLSENNYIYISHLNNIDGQDFSFWLLPFYPDTISDSMASNFQETQALGRSAPVYTFSNSGPRKVQIELPMHRDMMNDVNLGNSNVKLKDGEDYFENLVHALQSIAVPKYNLTNMAVEPPLVALRIANQVFIKGVVTSGIGITYERPILSNDKYACVKLSIEIAEVDPYDATSVFQNGSMRGEVQTFRNGYTKWTEHWAMDKNTTATKSRLKALTQKIAAGMLSFLRK